jgi:hypothetical protein
VVRCPAADTPRRDLPCGVAHHPGSAVRLPRRAADPAVSAPGPPRSADGPQVSADGRPVSAAGPPRNADGPQVSAIGPPVSAAGPQASAACLPGSALHQLTIAPYCAACRHRIRRPVLGPDSAMRCVSPGALRRRPMSACLAAALRRPRSGTSRALPAPSRASLCAAGHRRRPPRGPSQCPVPRREEPAFPGRGQPSAHRMTAGCSQKSPSSCGHRRKSGPSSGCARPPGRRWPCHLAVPRVLQPRRPTSSMCLTVSRQAKRVAQPHRERPSSSMSGGDLLSHAVPRAVPSAQKGLTSGFGMGPGVSPSL